MTKSRPRLSVAPSSLAAIPKTLATAQPGTWRKPGASSTERGYGYRWQQARSRYLQANPLCVMCREEGRITPATVVDHLIPHEGDERLFWDEGNWRAICKPHHDSEAQRKDNEYKSR